MALLEVKDLRTSFRTEDGIVKAVDGVTFSVEKGQTLGIVGESGSGKSVTCLTIMGLNSRKNTISSGEALWKGKDLLTSKPSELRGIRGDEMSMIFQEPMTSLNPVMTIGRQLGEVLSLHQTLTKSELRAKVVALLSLVRIPEAAQRARQYPHQLSGGMRQRVMIAIALACNPKVLIADEPTTALDVTVQAQILELIVSLQKKLGTAVILITHDLGLVAQTAQRVIVMYAGRKVEEATVGALFAAPQHQYTRGLMASLPRLGLLRGETAATGRLQEIPGMVPPLTNLPPGCAFAPRCPRADERCRAENPAYEEKAAGHWAACWHPGPSNGRGHD